MSNLQTVDEEMRDGLNRWYDEKVRPFLDDMLADGFLTKQEWRWHHFCCDHKCFYTRSLDELRQRLDDIDTCLDSKLQ